MLSRARFDELLDRIRHLRIAVVGDFCLDRYLDVDLTGQERSIETGLPVWNVTQVRPQPGGCGTVVNNLVALGVAEIYPVGFYGCDGEGWELHNQLRQLPGVRLDHFRQTPSRRTFTYTKLMSSSGAGPAQEFQRIDFKNWTATPNDVSQSARASLRQLVEQSVDGVIVLDQCDLPNVGVVTDDLLKEVGAVAESNPERPIVADSRSGLRRFPPVTWKMNRSELQSLLGQPSEFGPDVHQTQRAARELADRNRSDVCVTMAELGIVAASPHGESWHVNSPPVVGPIDVVGAGDAVTATFTASRAAGADILEAIQMAVLAGYVVVHQLGTTGTAQPNLMAVNLPSLSG